MSVVIAYHPTDRAKRELRGIKSPRHHSTVAMVLTTIVENEKEGTDISEILEYFKNSDDPEGDAQAVLGWLEKEGLIWVETGQGYPMGGAEFEAGQLFGKI